MGSQPAVDSASSEDPIVGWGPARGYVFQKAFVEFFIPSAEVEMIEGKLKAKGDGQISMYASNKQGEFKTNTTDDAVNAVTWGVFPGQEIVQSTIIEATSFLAWKVSPTVMLDINTTLIVRKKHSTSGQSGHSSTPNPHPLGNCSRELLKNGGLSV